MVLSKTVSDSRTVGSDQRPAKSGTYARLDRGAEIGRYIVLERLGRGGMGIVYSAYDPQLDRRVALKLLHDEGDAGETASDGQVRLLREAQAMAKLVHPNVVTVHDVGSHENRVFIAMEYVDGCTVKEWLRKQRRAWREVIAVFVRAGRGLMAAHAAGVVHRDLKPDNIMIDQADRVLVMDFGLARHSRGAPEQLLDSQTATTAPQDVELTRAGQVIGTPAYMAPEQHIGLPVDARSDQFSFCVALWEAVYGVRPFPGKDYASLAFAVTHGEISERPTDARVPGWVRGALRRGLESNPAKRWPSMDALLSRLEHDPSAARKRWLGRAVIGLVGVGAIAGFYLTRQEREALCRGAEAKLEGVWDVGRKRAVREAFAGLGLAYANETWLRVEAILDDYAGAWVREHASACEATHVHREQSEELLDLRMSCLNQRLHEVSALVQVFAEADTDVVERAVAAAHGLEGFERCSDVELLTARLRPPKDRAAAEAVEGLRRDLAEARGLEGAGRYRQALAIAERTAMAASELGYRPAEAEALYELGTLQSRVGEYEAAERSLDEAVLAAQSCRYDEVAARSMTSLVTLVGDRRGRPDQGKFWARHARASIEAAGMGEQAVAYLLRNLAHVLENEGELSEALAAQTRAHEILERERGSNHPDVALTVAAMARVLDSLGRYDEALAQYQRALEIQKAVLGPSHPDVAVSSNNLGVTFFALGRNDDALDAYQQAQAIWEQAVGVEHPFTASAISNIANVYFYEQRYDDAVALHTRALAIRERALGSQHAEVGTSLSGLANAFQAQGRNQDSYEHQLRALEIWERSLGPDHPNTAAAHLNVGSVSEDLGNIGEAMGHFRQALESWERTLGSNHPNLAMALGGIARMHAARGNLERSLLYFDRAVALNEAHGMPARNLAATFTRFADVLWRTGRRARAVELMRRVQARLADTGDAHSEGLAREAAEWLEEH